MVHFPVFLSVVFIVRNHSAMLASMLQEAEATISAIVSDSWVGLENALGDFVAVIDPLTNDIGFVPEMLDKAMGGADVVFAINDQAPRQSLAYRAANSVFQYAYKWFNGIHLAREAPQYRILSKRVINFILQHPQPAMTYRHLPATAGFAKGRGCLLQAVPRFDAAVIARRSRSLSS